MGLHIAPWGRIIRKFRTNSSRECSLTYHPATATDWSSPGYGHRISVPSAELRALRRGHPSGTFMVIAMMAYLKTTFDYVLNELGVRSGCQTGNECHSYCL